MHGDTMKRANVCTCLTWRVPTWRYLFQRGRSWWRTSAWHRPYERVTP
jgi:hypothetical protein